jgi:hypothetical protein
MMSAPREGAECLAEIFREILALSETKRSNDPKSAAAGGPQDGLGKKQQNIGKQEHDEQDNAGLQENQD